MKVQNALLTLLAAATMTACGGNKQTTAATEPTLKETFGDKFLIGAAINTWQAAEKDSNAVNILRTHFNSVVSENDMKMESVHPEEGRFDFEKADALIRFGEKYNMSIIGHCLIWHSQ